MKFGSYEIEDITISYAEFGKAKANTIVVFAGVVSSLHSSFFKMFNHLPQRVVAIARPGYGASTYFEMESVLDYAKKLEGFFDYLNIDTFSVVGISAGAPYAHAVAKHFGSRVKESIIAVGMTEAYKKEHMDLFSKENQDFFTDIRSMTKKEAGIRMYNIYAPAFSAQARQTSDFLDSFQNEGLHMGQEALLQVKPWGFDLSEITCPVTFLQGTKDFEISYDSVVKTVESMKNAKLITFKNAGHLSFRVFYKLRQLIKKSSRK